ncbi:MAG TPA: glycosyltransferase family 1 protein [Ilumatobacteraceae bacterium]
MQGVQMPANALRGIGRWCTEYTMALADLSPQTIAAVSIDEQLAPPAVVARLAAQGVPVLTTSQPPPALDDGGYVFHALSPLEDLPLARVWPKWARDPKVGLVATLYDMIPLLFPEDYFQGALKRLLQVRYELYRQAGATIGISQATIDDAVRLLRLDPTRTFVASGGIAARFTPHPDGRLSALSGVVSLGVRRDFLLTIGNVDPRKNVLPLMDAYAALSDALRHEHQLVVTCSQADERHLDGLRTHARNLGIADRVIVLPFVTDDVMVALYQACALMVYPSLYEGLGLPIIEAMACGAATLVSDVGPMREIVTTIDARFDPTSTAAIRERIEFTLTNETFLTELRVRAVKDASRYTWSDSTGAALAAYRAAVR